MIYQHGGVEHLSDESLLPDEPSPSHTLLQVDVFDFALDIQRYRLR